MPNLPSGSADDEAVDIKNKNQASLYLVNKLNIHLFKDLQCINVKACKGSDEYCFGSFF